MKKITLILLFTACLCGTHAQVEPDPPAPISFDTVGADTARGIAVVERYLSMIDFSQYRTDSVLCVVTHVIDRSNPHDTMTVYRWYMAPRYNRIEIWQNGRIEDGYHSDGVKLFRKFHTMRREWANLTPDSYHNISQSFDIRGALYDWRTKGAEIYYAGEVTYEGQTLDRVFVTSPKIFDRYYYFERGSGMLGLVVEDEHIYGDAQKALNSVRADWRAWHGFVPIKGFYLPSEESYQTGQQVVILHHSYHYEAPQTKLFTEDFHRTR